MTDPRDLLSSASEEMNVNYAAEYKPSVWQRIAWWHRWPWRPPVVPPDQRVWGTQPRLVIVREDGVPIGWHPLDSDQATVVIVLGRWSCLAGIIRVPHFEVEFTRDSGWRAPTNQADEQREEEAP